MHLPNGYFRLYIKKICSFALIYTVMYQYKATILRVVDGDTVDVSIDLGFGVIQKTRIRVIAENNDYFDTPETWRPKTEAERKHGEEAKAKAIELLEGKTVILDSVKKGKYRYVGKITLENGEDYGDTMINEGFQKRDGY
jgi:micrococcal nuclease